MAETDVENVARGLAEQWRERIAEQGQSGLSVRQFCKERGLTQWSFYRWRKRLRESGPMRFALVDRGAPRPESAVDADVELVFASGERLRFRSGIEGARLRTVLEVLRG
jgi:transposase-like protein